MKKLATGLATLSLLCLLNIGTLAYEKDLKEHVQINDEVWVNNTLVKPGKYLIEYSATTGEMKITSGKQIVAQAKATVKVNSERFDRDALLTRTTSMGQQLTGVRLGGQHEELDLSDIVVSIEQVSFEEDEFMEYCQ
jgi:hypothetical protein